MLPSWAPISLNLGDCACASRAALSLYLRWGVSESWAGTAENQANARLNHSEDGLSLAE